MFKRKVLGVGGLDLSSVVMAILSVVMAIPFGCVTYLSLESVGLYGLLSVAATILSGGLTVVCIGAAMIYLQSIRQRIC